MPSRPPCTSASASSSARTRCSSACSSRCSPAATCCSRASPAWPRRSPCGRWRTVARRHVPPHPVHARPRAGRPRRHAHLAAGRRHVPDRARPGVHQPAARPTRSTARPPRCSPRCSRSCRSTRSRSAARRHRVPEPFLVLATQNPIESEGTYDLPEAQVDRFLFKVVVDYPAVEDEIAVVDKVSVQTPRARRAMEIEDLLELPAGRPRGVRGALDHRLRRRARRRHAPSRPLRPRRPRAADPVRRQPARVARPRAGRPRARAAARPHARRSTTTCATSRRTCCATGSCSPTTRSPTASGRTS